MLHKIGDIHQIRIEKETALAFDPNLIVKQLQDKWPAKELSLSDLHNAVKSLGIVDYNSDDMDRLIRLLASVGFKISPA